MHIQLETPDNHAIRSYTDTEIIVGETLYQESVIISTTSIISTWPIQSVLELNEEHLKSILSLNPEILIIGHQKSGAYIPLPLIEHWGGLSHVQCVIK